MGRDAPRYGNWRLDSLAKESIHIEEVLIRRNWYLEARCIAVHRFPVLGPFHKDRERASSAPSKRATPKSKRRLDEEAALADSQGQTCPAETTYANLAHVNDNQAQTHTSHANDRTRHDHP